MQSIQQGQPRNAAPLTRRLRTIAWVVTAGIVLAVWEVATLKMIPFEAALAVSFAAAGLGSLLYWLGRPRRSGSLRAASNTTATTEATASTSLLNSKRWSLDVFAAIDSTRFAAVCETWFNWAGFETRAQSHKTDEGVDIWLHAAKIPGPVAIVRCKHWLDRPVGLQDMEEFSGLMQAHSSAHGTFTTTSTYTPEALQFARDHGIDAVDGRGLLRRIQTRTRQSQQALLAVAYGAHA